MIETITSRKNQRIKEAAGLVRSAESRRAQGLFVVEGARLCYDALRSGVPVQQLFFTPQAREKYGDYVEPLVQAAQAAFCTEPHVAELLSGTKNSQGVFAVCAQKPRLSLEALPETGRYLGLEALQDPGNLGAVMRTAEALGIAGLALFGECCDVYNPKALRAGMGAAFRLPVYQGGSFAEIAPHLHRRGFATFAAVPDAGAQPVTDCPFPEPCLLLVGNEGSGLLPETIEACSQKVTIPMKGRAESLNAASSSAILMWEMMR